MIAEKLLLALSRPFETADRGTGNGEGRIEGALSLLCRVYPDFLSLLPGRRVLDFGSGWGAQAVAMAHHGAERVVGIDANPSALERARKLALAEGVAGRVEFLPRLEASLYGQFDLVISQNSMEHFPDPEGVLAEMARAMAPNGTILITFGPPWFAPYGSHMQFFTRVPWVNLLFSEATVMRVRRRYRSDGARRYTEVEAGLNQMTLAKFERIVARSGLKIRYSRLDGVKGWNALAKVPLVRELFTNHVTCTLTRG